MVIYIFADPCNQTYFESLWWELFKNHKRTQIQIHRQWHWQRQRHRQSAWKNPTYAIFLKSWWLTHSKYDDRYIILVILVMPVTLVTLFRSYNQFYRGECIIIHGKLAKKVEVSPFIRGRNIFVHTESFIFYNAVDSENGVFGARRISKF